jgi:hypothetical protein
MSNTQRSVAGLLFVLAVMSPMNAQTFTKPPTTVSVYVTGPTWLNVGSDVPARVWVIWPPIANASGYRISRSVGGGSLAPAEVFPSSQVYAGNIPGSYMYPHVLPSDDSLALYNLQVNAFFVNGTDTTWSGPSPVSSARSIPNRPPANLQYSVTSSTNKMGLLRAAVRWDKWYTGVRGYKVRIMTGSTIAAEYSAIPSTQTSVVIDYFPSTNESFGQLAYEIKRNQKTTVCVCTRWPTTAAPFSPWACTPTMN